MKKKMLGFLTSLILSFSILATPFSEGHQYLQLRRPSSSELQVLEFFSFYCLHCYQFERLYNISSLIKKELPTGVKLKKYHVDFLGPMGKQLTQAWAVAMLLNIEDKVSPLLFEELQQKKTIKTLNDIRTIFSKIGISEEEYNLAWNSFSVKTLVLEQEKMASDLRVSGVPAVFINEKYMIKNDGLDMSSIDAYIKELVNVINFLLTLK
ncbi:thiol:disulfide interchange protein DsbA [Sodalis sp. CWE]|uniref:thiol:disulfide interchange protein DsbA n=1 Tax=Sodalis sp. CWE TaxID=2803816 RepID=UPI001C7D7D65|nr:thiol:disulfide interchange protein DsbA [Sodalis sp. CWE]MBX4180974.1 thiol:disulfide interchange protein DsbA [Sodalis sp. CWE]